MKSFTFRQYKRSPKEESNSPDAGPNEPKNKDSAAYQKRREQVRRAQRTHRERKESYTKHLESEILQLRNSESYLLLKTHSYEQELARLQKILTQNGIPYQQETDWLAAPDAGGVDRMMTGTSIQIAQNPMGDRQLHVDVNGGAGGNLWLTESEGNGTDAPKRSFFGLKKDRGREDAGFEPGQGNALSVANPKVGELAQTELGIEFVLTLESPCLGHIQGEIANGVDHATCHTFTATASLLQHSSEQLADMPEQTEWSAPYVALENLLKLSTELDFEGGLAPVQVWARLRQCWGFENLDLARLKWLTQEMLKRMKCHGFGAVIDEETFGRLVNSVWPRVGSAF